MLIAFWIIKKTGKVSRGRAELFHIIEEQNKILQRIGKPEDDMDGIKKDLDTLHKLMQRKDG